LVLICPPAKFKDLPGYEEFIVPTIPSQNHTVPAGAMAEQIHNITRRHNTDDRDFNLYRAVDKACKQQLLEAYPMVFLEKLQHATLEFVQVMTLMMLTHLWATYECISPADTMVNQQAANFWKPPDPIQKLLTKIAAHVDFVVAGEAPISDIMIVEAAYMNLEISRGFADDCKIWHNQN
jgi:hypothetical protein